jgi:hypothetical protein
MVEQATVGPTGEGACADDAKEVVVEVVKTATRMTPAALASR